MNVRETLMAHMIAMLKLIIPDPDNEENPYHTTVDHIYDSKTTAFGKETSFNVEDGDDDISSELQHRVHAHEMAFIIEFYTYGGADADVKAALRNGIEDVYAAILNYSSFDNNKITVTPKGDSTEITHGEYISGVATINLTAAMRVNAWTGVNIRK